MPGRDEGKLVVWPHYFDKTLSRAKGRRVPADLAVENPKAHDVAKAAKTLGLSVELLEDAKPPAFWHSQKGCVLVAGAEEPKEAILKQLARRL
jgi:signal recognition particle subunit SRP19